MHHIALCTDGIKHYCAMPIGPRSRSLSLRSRTANSLAGKYKSQQTILWWKRMLDAIVIYCILGRALVSAGQEHCDRDLFPQKRLQFWFYCSTNKFACKYKSQQTVWLRMLEMIVIYRIPCANLFKCVFCKAKVLIPMYRLFCCWFSVLALLLRTGLNKNQPTTTKIVRLKW